MCQSIMFVVSSGADCLCPMSKLAPKNHRTRKFTCGTPVCGDDPHSMSSVRVAQVAKVF
jgi:hypothetical protein